MTSGALALLVVSVAIGPPVQVNVGSSGDNIPGDAANEPSLAVDPDAPNRLVVVWRQFDSVPQNLRTAGWATSRDGGRSWRYHGSIDGDGFRTDPVVAAMGGGSFVYYGLADGFESADLFVSGDGGETWSGARPAYGGDKPWMAADRGRGHVYAVWSDGIGCCQDRVFTRSTDGGATFSEPVAIDPTPVWGSMTVGLGGEVLVGGVVDIATLGLARSSSAADPSSLPAFTVTTVPLEGTFSFFVDPNPQGLPGMVWVGVDTSTGPYRGTVYLLASLDPPGPDPLDVLLYRSADGGDTFTGPVRVHPDGDGTWQWFGCLDVAPDGRVDVAWIESLEPTRPEWGEVRATSSVDGGASFAAPVPVSPPFDSHLGWPERHRLGDYMQLVSDRMGAFLAFAATLNGEQDVFVARIGPYDCDGDGVSDARELADGTADDCDGDGVPDACEIAAGAEPDLDGDGRPDRCLRSAMRRAPRRMSP